LLKIFKSTGKEKVEYELDKKALETLAEVIDECVPSRFPTSISETQES
jgi:hypothetical protein